MAKLNPKAKDYRIDTESRLAGGYGPFAAKQDPEALLRRCVMACLLWEKLAYEKGSDTVTQIKNLIPQVSPDKVAEIALEAREKQKLRHVPLLIIREMARLPEHKKFVGELIPRVCTRADMLTDLLALYWSKGKTPVSAQIKKGLAAAFTNLSKYQISKYNRDDGIKLRDVLFLTHPVPYGNKSELSPSVSVPAINKPNYKRGATLRNKFGQGENWGKLVEGTLESPDTWEVNLSAGKDKKETWTRLIEEKKIPALAFMRNLRNMQKDGVDYSIVSQGFANINAEMLLPLNFLAAQREAPDYTREIESTMLRRYQSLPKLPGWTVFVLDISGSMCRRISSKSQFSRMDVGIAMMTLAAETAERVSLYVTAGNDYSRVHSTSKVTPVRGFALDKEVRFRYNSMGGGGIFTRQTLEWVKTDLKGETPDRIIVFSDSQDCDHPHLRVPSPFGKRNYIIDISAHKHGINYDGIWDAEISGWSEHFLTFIGAMEGLNVTQEVEN